MEYRIMRIILSLLLTLALAIPAIAGNVVWKKDNKVWIQFDGSTAYNATTDLVTNGALVNVPVFSMGLVAGGTTSANYANVYDTSGTPYPMFYGYGSGPGSVEYFNGTRVTPYIPASGGAAAGAILLIVLTR